MRWSIVNLFTNWFIYFIDMLIWWVGAGVDRHLFGLYVVSKYLEEDSPFLKEVSVFFVKGFYKQDESMNAYHNRFLVFFLGSQRTMETVNKPSMLWMVLFFSVN